jgi:hypothetical protein
MVEIKKEQETREGEQMGKDNLNIIRKWKISKIYLETKIERQKWRNVRNKMVQIKGVQFKSPLIIKYEIKL